ncbi:MAG: hypothetical protein VKK98_04660, partial [Cyanobacteriota bacterium]|nr:hypothetical protein [Cyanobacteriota bacterium]
MTPAPQITLEALFAHPLRHNIRWEHLCALWRSLGGEIERLDQQRLRLRLPDGSDTWMHQSGGRHHAVLSADDVLRVRRLLDDAGIRPQASGMVSDERGDQARRLLIRLDHRSADAYWFEGDGFEHATLQPHGLWATGQNLTHRHDRDVAGQRAPLDHEYLSRLSELLESADRVLVLGHGHGEASLIPSLLRHLAHHRPDLLNRIDA